MGMNTSFNKKLHHCFELGKVNFSIAVFIYLINYISPNIFFNILTDA